MLFATLGTFRGMLIVAREQTPLPAVAAALYHVVIILRPQGHGDERVCMRVRRLEQIVRLYNLHRSSCQPELQPLDVAEDGVQMSWLP